jgi:hypothetical protein
MHSYSTFNASAWDDEGPDHFDVEEDSDTEDEPVQQAEPEAHADAPTDKRLNIKKKKPAGEASAVKAQYDNLGGDRALVEKLLPAWKQRNSADLATLLELNKRVKKPDGSEDPQLAKQRKTLVDKMGKTDPMPTAALVAKMSLEERLEKLQAT